MTLVNLSATLTAALTALAPLHSSAVELQPETLQAWQVFLWADEAPGREWRLTRGEILVSQTEKNGVRSVPSGLIHDDYDRYRVFYKPVVADSKLLHFPERSITGLDRRTEFRSPLLCDLAHPWRLPL